ncbi:hypothetical protein HanHA300_Chr05g0158451 [Helianthus annuus]|nr:hypothetical protein HanHA300_Chr05g0158451 [Helianthus annuus]
MLFVEQELAMLRQLIGRVQELLDLYDTPPLPPPYLLRHPPPTVLQPPPHLCNDRLNLFIVWRLFVLLL